MIRPSTVQLSNVKLKRVSKVHHVLYNDSAGWNTISKCQHIEEFTREVCALLFYVHTTMYNIINCNCSCVLIVHLYRLIWFHTQISFHESLSVRVSYLGHPVTYAIQFCTNKLGQKIYQCMPVQSTRHHTLQKNLTILHTKTFSRQPVTHAIYSSACQHAPHDIISFYIIL